ncbi:type IV inositol polyphosphate 5-phosphatase 11 isoform X2 [Diospyros lotus]|uniref:type IV inositol polyphosphate 5-phosphatase 11 isoform X2 n=1 Tax=Diospyros lotus TaxID=55363 RepID=UPI0022501252|nr:type IV inositol polyphosphate 5-phosphatase 11 isoform X2 [Diospyros lotus]
MAVHHHEGIKCVGLEDCCDFSSSSDLCICMVTWNMNGQVRYEDIEKLVGIRDHQRRFDLLAVGLQEAPRKDISRLLQTALVQTHVLLGKAVMQSVQLYVFGPKNKSEVFLKEVKMDKHGVGGFGGLVRRKKGAVGIRMKYKGVGLLFISCHLSAHAGKVEERNREWREISRSLFSEEWNPYSRPPHVTVWLGDLNYRLQGIAASPAATLMHHNLHQQLTSKDQLLQEAERGQVFNGYLEGILTFKPTYKFDIGSSTYDTSHKVRVPSWTDRILFKIEELDNIQASLHSYESIDTIHSSDHRPVQAHLCFKLSQACSSQTQHSN